jgi:hypothetical protein
MWRNMDKMIKCSFSDTTKNSKNVFFYGFNHYCNNIFYSQFFYGDLIYELKKRQRYFFSVIRKTICKFKKRDYQHDILQRSAGLVINPSTVTCFDHYAYLFVCTRWQGFKSLWRFMGKSLFIEPSAYKWCWILAKPKRLCIHVKLVKRHDMMNIVYMYIFP